MELLQIAAADPVVLPLWLVFAFAVSFYPLGMLFGCSACCNVCRNCCRDEVGQVVVEFSLSATGEQTVKATPFSIFGFDAVTRVVDGTTAVPMFMLTGSDSGARALVRAIGVQGGYAPHLSGPVKNGNQYLSEFVDGESVTVAPIHPANVIEAASLTAVVGACVFNQALGQWQRSLSFAGDPGVFDPIAPDPGVDFTVDCQGEEGSVVFDVAERNLKQPATCDTCNIVVERMTLHPASFLLNPCSDPLSGVYSFAAESSSLSVSVPLSVLGRTEDCPAEITATASTYWLGFGGGDKSPPSCQQTTLHTITPAEQDCLPFSSWPADPADPPDNYLEQLVYLSATACFGSGFSGIATEPTGAPGDGGPITAVAVTEPGSGYAEIGRVEPTLTISGSGSGADLEVSLAQVADGCGRPRWTIDAVTLGPGGGGTGYTDGEQLSVTVDEPGTEGDPAVLTVSCGREAPSLVADYPLGGGSGAVVTVSVTPSTLYANTWEVDEFTVVDGGSGWTWGQYVTAVGETDEDVKVLGVDAYVRTTITEPTIGLAGGSGSGAALAVTLASNGTAYGPPSWNIASVGITSAGTGYQVTDSLTIDLIAGDVEIIAATVTVSTVNGSGGITGLNIQNGGAYYHEGGTISSIEIDDYGFGYRGSYYRTSDVVESVTVVEGGLFWEDDPTAPAIVSPITINISQRVPSAGAGADIEAVVDDDPASDTFGEIVGLTIVDGGDDYLAVWVTDGPCSPGGLYRSLIPYCGVTHADADPARGGVLFARGCPDYTYSISIQGPA